LCRRESTPAGQQDPEVPGQPASAQDGTQRPVEEPREYRAYWRVGEDPAGVYGSLGHALERSSVWSRTAGRGPPHAASPVSRLRGPCSSVRRRLLLRCLGPGFADVLPLPVTGKRVVQKAAFAWRRSAGPLTSILVRHRDFRKVMPTWAVIQGSYLFHSCFVLASYLLQSIFILASYLFQWYS
jgi:hypothetical protein